jgi:ABC-2 type transport system permease protein
LFFAGKIVPFFLINQLQAVTMLLVGVYLVPLLGGQALALDGSPAALALLLAATSLAAIGYAILVAVFASSVAQASIIGGVGIILLGSIGGVMAPKFLMPEAMQKLADISPMAWALDGMLDVLLRGAGPAAVAPRAAALGAFAAACLLVAAIVFLRRSWRP